MKNINQYLLCMFIILLTLSFTYNKKISLSPVLSTHSICNTTIGQSLVTLSSKSKFSFINIEKQIGVGIIINCKHKIIVTNSKISSKFTDTTVTLPTGQKYTAKSIYDNPLLYFSLLQIETEDDIDCSQISLPKRRSQNIKKDMPVIIYGIRNEGKFVYQSGIIEKTKSNISLRYGAVYKIKHTFSQEENKNLIAYNTINELIATINPKTSELIGINIINNIKEGYSLTLNIQYIKYALKSYLRNTNKPIIETGDIGIRLKPIDVRSASVLYNYSTEKCGEGLNFLVILNVLKNYNSDNILFPNDIMISINNIKTSNDVRIVDRILNKNIGKEIEINLCRNGESIIRKVIVNNSQAYLTDRLLYIKSEGFVLRDVNIVEMYQHTIIDMRGVVLSFTNDSTCQEELKNSEVLIKQINGKDIDNIDEFVKGVIDNCGLNLIMSGFDLVSYKTIVVNSKWEAISKEVELYDYDFKDDDWKLKKINLSELC